MDQLHKETDEAHDAEAYRCGDGDLLEFCKWEKIIILRDLIGI